MKTPRYKKAAHLLVIAFCTICIDVESSSSNRDVEQVDIESVNLLKNLSDTRMGDFKWQNKPEKIAFNKEGLVVTSAAKTDFFIDPSNAKSTESAPFLYQEVEGDFIATALVEPDLSNTWNAACVMVFVDSSNWIKFAFENSDATGNSIVSVVTRGTSDDANGVRLGEFRKVWLKLIRKNDIYSMLWSGDGKQYFMARLSKMPTAKKVRVGLEAQSPLEKEATHKFHYFSIEKKTVENLRTGV